ncbi:chitin synthase-domain-containing protein [Phascolomyces articulosus]|uniref:chitin synthase n=1 Tax=Phascolomyces articulosus TaxID=60185 RepID=A0AAD5JSI1_9FUNG|nr:chitin synthase-domain-containing protein [Phascolomyces articulosus]
MDRRPPQSTFSSSTNYPQQQQQQQQQPRVQVQQHHHQFYSPALNQSGAVGSSSATDNSYLLQSQSSQRPRRQKSLVRPERERIDETHRQYHYRRHASKRGVAPSSTGNQPIHQQQQQQQQQQHLQHQGTIQRKVTVGRKQSFVRRGKSILGREEKDDENDPRRHIGGLGGETGGTNGAVNTEYQESFWNQLPNPWLFYCRVLTCCIPGSLLSACGIPKGPAHMAWREKIGLLSFIACVMGFVGFLTFGFTQAVCPTPPLAVQGGEVSAGYLIIHGWAYLLSDWEGHPPISGQTSENTNIMYPPINAGGMDASLLFQDNQAACADVLGNTGPVYFPCQLFNPNTTDVPDPSTFSNQTQCHLTSTARSMYNSFEVQGVPKPQGGFDKAARVYYDWDRIDGTTHLMVFNGDVLNIRLLQSLPSSTTFPSGGLIEAILADEASFGGKDMTRAMASRRTEMNWEKEAECLAATIKVGSLDTLSIGCMASQIVLYLSLCVILGVILTKFFLAVTFGWFLSWRLGNFKEGGSYAERMKRQAEIEDWSRNINTTGPIPKSYMSSQINLQNKKKSILPQTSRFTQPQHVMRFDAERGPSPYWKNTSTTGLGRQSMYNMTPSPSVYNMTSSPSSRFFSSTPGDMTPRRTSISSSDMSSSAATSLTCPFPLSPYVIQQPSPDYMPFKFPLAHTVCLVTCYSEGEEGIRTTLDSIATSDYPNSHKLILVICDGIITGSGNNQSTPDACLSMMRDFIVPPERVQPSGYMAIADGSKQNNMAKVYAGYYKYKDETVDPAHQQRVPMVLIVKCGTPEEATEPKPGNRGKRDSQIILMQFMQKVIFDERLTLMEYEFFNSVWRVTGVPADSYEICLMVDADTKLYPDALSRMVSCAVKDPEISGLCGETKIANKTDSWVSMIQVFEYYISHHMNKAFEAIFGGVTCLPGCFCMYRIKAPKGPTGYWVPVLANPDVVQHYSENVVDTLHKKNLLLLGEDRYLSTLMLKTFPNRKMMFVPQAVCKTVVPDSFRVLLSQRRRWINSTIHNLMELLFVHDLCGTFCFSMQFVVFMELVGTLALPAAIAFTLYLIILAITGNPAIIPLILLALILGLPAVLIVMTSRKVVYVGWMFIYLFSLPIWNFVLPMYAYWHFDDFSWGDTRRVEGNEKDRGHGDRDGEFDSTRIVMKKWSEYEKERRIQLAMEHNLPMPRFLERPKSVDIFRDSLLIRSNNTKKSGSTGSSDSEAPLAEMDFQTMRQQQQQPTPIQLSDPPVPMTSFNTTARSGGNNNEGGNGDDRNMMTTATSSSTSSPITTMIPPTIDPFGYKNNQQSSGSSTSDWANPAPHHKPAPSSPTKPRGFMASAGMPSTPTPERIRGPPPPTQQQQQQSPYQYVPLKSKGSTTVSSSTSAPDRTTLPQHSSPLSQSTTPSSEEQISFPLLPSQQQLSSSSSSENNDPVPTSSSNSAPPPTSPSSNHPKPTNTSPLATAPPIVPGGTQQKAPAPPPKTMDKRERVPKPRTVSLSQKPPVPPPHQED